MARRAAAAASWLFLLLMVASHCAVLAQNVSAATYDLRRSHSYPLPTTDPRCRSHWRRYGRFPSWCSRRSPGGYRPSRPPPPPPPAEPEGASYLQISKNASIYHWATQVKLNMYPQSGALEHARRDLALFVSDHGKGSLKTLPPPTASASTLKPATDDMVKAGLKAGQTASQQTAKFMLDCVTKEACAKIFSKGLETFAKDLAKTLPNFLTVGVPVLGIAIQVLIALFWPDTAGTPPVTLDQVKDLVDKKVIEATDKLGQQLLASMQLYTDASIGEAIADIDISLAASAFIKGSELISNLGSLDNLPACAKLDPVTGNCAVFNSLVFDTLQSLVDTHIPNALEKILPPGIKLTDYAAARRIPYLVTVGQLALPILFQWAWMAEGLNSDPSKVPVPINYRLNAQLRRTIVDLSSAIDQSINSSIWRRTVKDLQVFSWDGTQTGANLPFQCGNTVQNKALRWCITDDYPGGPKSELVLPFQGINEDNDGGDPHHRFLLFRRIGMVYYAQSIRWGITSPLLYASLTGVAAPSRVWSLWGTDLRQNSTNNATALAAVTPVWKTQVAHVGPFGGSCTFQALPWWVGTQGCLPTLDVGTDQDSQFYLCMQCLWDKCSRSFTWFCGENDASGWCSGDRQTFGWCHTGRQASDYYPNPTQTQSDACGSRVNVNALRAKCMSDANKIWNGKGCGVPEHRQNEVNTLTWTRYRKCMMDVPATSAMCHNSFVNGKATVEDIYTSDRSKWVAESVHFGLNSHFDRRSCDCDIPPGDDGPPTRCGTPQDVGMPTHDYETRRVLPPINYPDALTPTPDKLEGFSAGGKFPFAYDSLGNITSIKMGYQTNRHMFVYTGITFSNGNKLVTPDYARDFSQMSKFASLGLSWCEVTLGANQIITGAVGVHDLAAVYDVANIETNVKEKSFVMRGITWVVSNINVTDWSVTPAFNVTCGDAPGSPSISPEAVQAGAAKTFVPTAPEGGYGLIDNSVELGVDPGHDAWLCHVDVLGIYGDEVNVNAINYLTGFKFSWCWNQLEVPVQPDWEACIAAGGESNCSPTYPPPPPATPAPPPPSPPTANSPPPPSPGPPVSDCTAVNWDKCPPPVITNSSRYCRSAKLCTCYTSDRQVSGCDPPACYSITEYDCADTVSELGYQTLSPCSGDDCPTSCANAGAPWDNKCRPQVG